MFENVCLFQEMLSEDPAGAVSVCCTYVRNTVIKTAEDVGGRSELHAAAQTASQSSHHWVGPNTPAVLQ